MCPVETPDVEEVTETRRAVAWAATMDGHATSDVTVRWAHSDSARPDPVPAPTTELADRTAREELEAAWSSPTSRA